MKTPGPRKESISEVRFDLASAKILVWIASVGRDAELTAEAHIYFFDLYQKLADYHHRYGQTARARNLQEKADEHYRLGGGDGPPHCSDGDAAPEALVRHRGHFRRSWRLRRIVRPSEPTAPDGIDTRRTR